MKLLFVCSSLEPGRDGVGDYTARLSAALVRQGNQAAIIALNDKFCSAVIEGSRSVDDNNISIIRLPTSIPLKERMVIACRFKDSFRPDWVSLQFVPFGFEKRGLPFGLGKTLLPLCRNSKLHLMFHELWVGMDTESGLKLRLWGKIQQLLIRQMVKVLRPDKIDTQTILYKEQLAKMNVASAYLPLFGNIRRPEKIRREPNKNDLNLSFIVFGNIHAGGDINGFAEEARLLQRSSGRKIEVNFLGRCGAELESWINAFRQNEIEVFILGEQPPSVVSEYLQKASHGLSSTPEVLAEKSGTVAAMIEHDLPVICICRNWIPQGFEELKTSLSIIRYNKGNLESCLKTPLSNVSYNGVDAVAATFAKTLTSVDG
jgi:hypothetical protein